VTINPLPSLHAAVADCFYRSKKLSPDEARTQIEVLRQSMLEL